ncbi:MAG: hypothetical protein IID31_07515 [Planctomycetes bacterium]|nr:hypothetical protein [Planctomycetota bacterium]
MPRHRHQRRGLGRTASRWITLCLLGFAPASNAQQSWTRQAPLPTSRSLNGVHFLTPTHGFVVGQNRHLLETQDGGATWTTRVAGPYGTDPFYTVYFSDPLHGFVAGNNSDGLRTIDGGQTWQPMTGLVAGSWREFDFVSPLRGFAGANGACAYTSDGGLTWDFRSVWPNAPVTYGLDFRDEDVGLVAGFVSATRETGLFRTSDGGRTWSNVLNENTNDVVFLDAETVLATVVLQRMIYRSSDAGLTWSPLAGPFEADGPLGALSAVGANLVFGISVDGDIWRSDDAGASWLKSWDGIGDLPYSWSLMFSDEQHGWATGPHGLIVKTTNGFTWEVVTNGVGMDVHDIQMHDDSYGLAVAKNGYVLRTTNGGERWELQKLAVTGQVFLRDESFNAVDILDQNFAVAAGPGGTVFKTHNGGQSWASIGFPLLSNDLLIHDVAFITPREGWVVGQRTSPPRDRGVYHTTDGGLSWELAFVNGALFVEIQFADLQSGWIQSAGKLQRRTVDGGQSWHNVLIPDHPLHGNPIVSAMSYADASTGWVVGWFGYIARTTDGGLTWTLQTFPDPQFKAFDVHAMSVNEVRVVGLDQQNLGTLLHSTDGGQTWTRQLVGSGFEVPSHLTARPSGRVWGAGFRGLILSNRQTCYADCDVNGTLDIFDFLCFQNSFVLGEPYACDCDPDPVCDIFDFLCFQNAFVAGCP